MGSATSQLLDDESTALTLLQCCIHGSNDIPAGNSSGQPVREGGSCSAKVS